jgi:hypothetical protein
VALLGNSESVLPITADIHAAVAEKSPASQPASLAHFLNTCPSIVKETGDPFLIHSHLWGIHMFLQKPGDTPKLSMGLKPGENHCYLPSHPSEHVVTAPLIFKVFSSDRSVTP